jgi:hypothetical protein
VAVSAVFQHPTIRRMADMVESRVPFAMGTSDSEVIELEEGVI